MMFIEMDEERLNLYAIPNGEDDDKGEPDDPDDYNS